MKKITFKTYGIQFEETVESVEELMKLYKEVPPGEINILNIEDDEVVNNLVRFKTSPYMEMVGLQTQLNNLILTFGYDNVQSALKFKEKKVS